MSNQMSSARWRALCKLLLVVAVICLLLTVYYSVLNTSDSDESNTFEDASTSASIPNNSSLFSHLQNHATCAFYKDENKNQEGVAHSRFDRSINNGCKKRNLFLYKPNGKITNYHHPSIVHYAKFHTTPGASLTLSYLQYMSLLSAYKIAKAKVIVIHSNAMFTGKYWDLTQAWTGTTVMVNHVEKIDRFGKEKPAFLEHMADYTKLFQVLVCGGVAFDFDSIFVHGDRLREMQSVSECIFPEEYNEVRFSFFSCVKNSPYIKEIVELYHTDYRPGWVYNAGEAPTKLLTSKKRKDCFNIYLDRTVCRPMSWHVKVWLLPNGVRWKDKTVVHYCRRNLGLLDKDENESLLDGGSSFSELLRNIIRN